MLGVVTRYLGRPDEQVPFLLTQRAVGLARVAAVFTGQDRKAVLEDPVAFEGNLPFVGVPMTQSPREAVLDRLTIVQ